VTKNSRQVSACGHEGRLVSSGAATGTQHPWRTEQCRALAPCGRHDAWLLTNSVPPGQGPITVRLPLLQSLHWRLANPATDAAHAEEREETNACDEPSNALIQLLTPCHWFPWLVSACLSEYSGILLLTRTLWASCPLLLAAGQVADQALPLGELFRYLVSFSLSNRLLMRCHLGLIGSVLPRQSPNRSPFVLPLLRSVYPLNSNGVMALSYSGLGTSSGERRPQLMLMSIGVGFAAADRWSLASVSSVLPLPLADRIAWKLGRTVTEANSTLATPTVRSRPTLKIPQ
jgi:hypothetical protein